VVVAGAHLHPAGADLEPAGGNDGPGAGLRPTVAVVHGAEAAAAVGAHSTGVVLHDEPRVALPRPCYRRRQSLPLGPGEGHRSGEVTSTVVPRLCGTGQPLRTGNSYLDGPLATTLIAWAYFLWRAWGLTPAQAAMRAQVCPASSRRRTW
jgi:hypothetical protein